MYISYGLFVLNSYLWYYSSHIDLTIVIHKGHAKYLTNIWLFIVIRDLLEYIEDKLYSITA